MEEGVDDFDIELLNTKPLGPDDVVYQSVIHRSVIQELHKQITSMPIQSNNPNVIPKKLFMKIIGRYHVLRFLPKESKKEVIKELIQLKLIKVVNRRKIESLH